jgi:4-amino-4-deoxy-L-arabinose transferase-like glycosyltransferase
MHHQPSENRWLWRSAAAALIVLASVLHVLYLIHDCPLDLAPDEAHYWDWSRHLDWSYYSKGPLVALLIRGSCELFGPWAEATTGSIMPAIRFPAVLCGALLLVSFYVLTVLAVRRESWAFGVVALSLTQPLIAAGSSLMTIDAPYTACWGWALVFAYLAAVRGYKWAWPVTGLVIALGILAKYTMVLFVPSLGLFLLFDWLASRSRIGLRRFSGFVVMCAVAALGAVPILVWNAQHEWVTFRHVGGQASAGEGWRWFGPLVFLGGQFGILLGFWFVVLAAALWRSRPWIETDADRQFLWWMSVPTLAVFLLLSLKTTGQLNWAVTAYISGSILAAAWLGERIGQRSWRFGTVATALLGLSLILAVHYPALSRPVLLSIVGSPTAQHPLPLRRVDPTARLRGYRTLAAAVDGLRSEARAGGEEPVVAATFWNVPGLLGAYGESHPEVYSLGSAMYDRRSQLDFWRPNPLWDPEQFRGRTFVLVGDFTPALIAAFDRLDPPRTIRYLEAGQPIAIWYACIGYGYRGFGPIEDLLRNKKY